MVDQQKHDATHAVGLRGRVGEWCHAAGLLRPLQRMRSWLRSDLRILAYHRVVTVDDPRVFDFDLDLVSTSADRFREQMLLLKKRFHPMLLGQALAAADAGESVPANTVVVTFDDGYDDNYRIAYPILRELGIPATFFVSTGHIDSGRPFAYDWLVHMILRTKAPRLDLPELNVQASIPDSRPARRRLAARILRDMKAFDDTDQRAAIQRLEREWNMPRGVRVRDCCPMSWDQLREMHAAGFEIGSHGVHHRELAKLTQAELQAELVDSRATLQRELGVTTHLIAYPVGGDQAFDERVMQAARGAGYDAACSYIFGTNSWSRLNRYALYRLPVEREMGLGWFAAMLTLPGLMGYPTVSRDAESDDEGRACSS